LRDNERRRLARRGHLPEFATATSPIGNGRFARGQAER
jgi:hypothetical protein